MKKQSDMTSPKEHSTSAEVPPDPKEICEIPETDFKIMIARKHNEIQENTSSLKKQGKQ